MLFPTFTSTGSIPVTILRRAKGSYANGRYVEASPTNVAIIANIQPGLKWNEMQQLPEGERTRKSLRLWTKYPVRMRKEGNDGWDADTFYYTDCNGETDLYQIMHVTSYRMGILNHFKAICIRVEVT